MVAVADGGAYVAYFRFDHEFNPGDRYDEEHVLDNLDPNYFKK